MNILTLGCGINLVLLLAISGSMAKPQERAGPSNLDTKMPVQQSQSQNGKTNAETIYINTDPANFKDQVQRLTGKQNILNRKRKQPAAITGPVGDKANHTRFGIVEKPAAANHNDASHSHRAEEPNWLHQAQSAAEAPTLGQQYHDYEKDLYASGFHDELDTMAAEKKLKLDQEPNSQHQAQWAAEAPTIGQHLHHIEKDLMASGSHEEMDQITAQKKRKLDQFYDDFHEIMGEPVQGVSTGTNQQHQGTFSTGEQQQQKQQLQQEKPQPELPQQYVQQEPIGNRSVVGTSQGNGVEVAFHPHHPYSVPAGTMPTGEGRVGKDAFVGGNHHNLPPSIGANSAIGKPAIRTIIKYDRPPKTIVVKESEFKGLVQALTGNQSASTGNHQHQQMHAMDIPHAQVPQKMGHDIANYGNEEMIPEKDKLLYQRRNFDLYKGTPIMAH